MPACPSTFPWTRFAGCTKTTEGGGPLDADLPTCRCFLLADAEVLEDAGRVGFWVKYVQPDYVAAD